MPDSDIERLLADAMAAYCDRQRPAEDEPLRAWRPHGYPTDYGRNPPPQDFGPEWDFRPADERWD